MNFLFPVPILIIAFLFFISYKLYKTLIQGSGSEKTKKEISATVVAVVIGILLGFASDMAKDLWQESSRKYKLQRSYYLLLKTQACAIRRDLIGFKKYMVHDKEGGAKLPYLIRLEYWNFLKNSPDFVNTIAEPPFNLISQKMLYLDELNQLVIAAKEQKDFMAPVLANEMFKEILDENFQESLMNEFQYQYDVYYYVPRNCEDFRK